MFIVYFLLTTDDYLAATMYIGHSRSQTPPVYNERRLFERPLPNLKQPVPVLFFDCHDEQNKVSNLDDSQYQQDDLNSENNERPFQLPVVNDPDLLLRTEVQKNVCIEPQINRAQLKDPLNISHNSSVQENRTEVVQNDNDSILSLDEQLNRQIPALERNSSKLLLETQAQENAFEDLNIKAYEDFPEIVVNEIDLRALDSLLDDDDVTFTCPGDWPKPMKPDGYLLKRNDSLSGNIPYKENVNRNVITIYPF